MLGVLLDGKLYASNVASSMFSSWALHNNAGPYYGIVWYAHVLRYGRPKMFSAIGPAGDAKRPVGKALLSQ